MVETSVLRALREKKVDAEGRVLAAERVAQRWRDELALLKLAEEQLLFVDRLMRQAEAAGPEVSDGA